MPRYIRTYVENEELVRQRREHIAQCAIRVFFEKGYKGATTRQLAKACGMSEGALYRYIGSKSDILHLICTRALTSRPILERFRSELGDISPTESLCRCIERYFLMEHEGADSVIFFGREIQNFSHEDRGAILRSQVDLVKFFESLLVEGINAGEFQIDNRTLMAHDIVMRGQDYALRRWFLKKLFTLQEYTQNYIKLILKCIQITYNLEEGR